MSSADNYKKNPVVFISYSWTSDEHINKVLKLAERLQKFGVFVKIDQWDLEPGQDLNKYMEQMVYDSSIDKVLIICDRKYSEKADAREGGVGKETQIITPDVYENAEQTKFIPLLFEKDENGKVFLPIYLKSRFYIDFSNENFENSFEILLRHIYREPENKRPDLGKPPDFNKKVKEIELTKTFQKVNLFKNLIFEGKPVAVGILKEYLDLLFIILEIDFKISEDRGGLNFDDLVIKNITDFKPYRDEFIDLIEFLINYNLEIKYFECIQSFFIKLLSLMNTTGYLLSPTDTDNYKFIIWEFYLYLLTHLVRERRYEEFYLFVGEDFYIENGQGESFYKFFIFQQPIRSLSEYRKNRLNSTRLSIVVDELKNRCNDQLFFSLLMQTDLMLFIRSKSLMIGSEYWRPNTLIYASKFSGVQFEFFMKSTKKSILEDLLIFLNLNNKRELEEFINKDETFKTEFYGYNQIDLKALCNFEKLGTM